MKKFTTMLALAIALTLNAIAPTYAGALGGSRYGDYIIRPFTTHTFQIAFRGGEYARVVVDGDGSTDLDLYIFDEWGRRVDSDDDETDYCTTRWYVGRIVGLHSQDCQSRPLLQSLFNCYKLTFNS